MGRKAKATSIDELQQKIIKVLKKNEEVWEDIDFDPDKPDYEDYTLFGPILYGDVAPDVSKDLGKIEFDFENFEAESYEVLSNGLACLKMYAGGDWECPVYFIIYLDNKDKLRGYVPEKGNTFNPANRSAFGNNKDSDEVELKKFTLDQYNSPEPDWTLMEQDIVNRIQIVP